MTLGNDGIGLPQHVSRDVETEGFPLLRHNVFFSEDYPDEFERIFAAGGLPDEIPEHRFPVEEGKVFLPKLLLATGITLLPLVTKFQQVSGIQIVSIPGRIAVILGLHFGARNETVQQREGHFRNDIL